MKATTPYTDGSEGIPARNRTYGLAAPCVAYLATSVVLGLAVGLVRSGARFHAGTLPDQYLVHSVAANALLMVLFGLVTLPAFLLLQSRLRRRGRVRQPIAVAGTGGQLAAYFLFWGFNTAIGFRVMREFFSGETKPVFDELVLWLPGFPLLGLLAGWLLLGADLRSRLTRSAAAGAALLLATLGLAAYSSWVKPTEAALPTFEAAAGHQPDIFLVLVDTLRADHLTTYGYSLPTSPGVDAFASDATVYDRAFAPASWTRPSCAALLSSRYPKETGLDGLFTPLAREVPILPQFLRAEGYRTAGIIASVQLNAQFGFDKGFDLHDTGTTYLQWTGTKVAYGRLGLVDQGEAYPRFNAAEVTDRAIRWIEQQDDAPLFMYLHYSDPHAPYRPPEAEDRWREFAQGDALEVSEPPLSPTRQKEKLSGARVEAMVARYDSEIAYFDSHFRRFLDYLKSTGRYEQSLILLTADHGEEFADHGGWLHGHSLYNELIHVPLIVKYPARLGLPTGIRQQALTGLLDVVPTVRDVLGARWPPQMFRGRSLLRPQLAADDYALFARNGGPPLRTAIWGADKLIQQIDAEGAVVGENYYSLETDLAETGDGTIPETLDPARLEEIRRFIENLDALDSPTREIQPDEQTLDELKALGYIE